MASTLLQVPVTIGCRHNQCTFCSMYKDKVFRVRSREEIYKDLEEMGLMYAHLPLRIFLADGDALTMDTKQLPEILGWIYQLFPLCQRVTIYGTTALTVLASEGYTVI